MKEQQQAVWNKGEVAKGVLLLPIAAVLLPCPPAGIMVGFVALEHIYAGLKGDNVGGGGYSTKSSNWPPSDGWGQEQS